MLRPHEKPLDVEAVENEVVLVGPGRIAGSMTVEAAQESLDRLQAAVDGARGAKTNHSQDFGEVPVDDR